MKSIAYGVRCRTWVIRVLRAGRVASAGLSSVRSLFSLSNETEPLPKFLCKILQVANRSQARVLLSLHFFSNDSAHCAKVVAQRAQISYDAARAAITQCRAQGWVNSDSYELTETERYEKHDSAIKNTTAQCFVPPQKSLQHPISDRSDRSDSVKTELTVFKAEEKQQTAVVVNFSIYQMLIKIGISNKIASQLIADDEDECRLQIARLEKLVNMPKNRAGYLRKSISMRYRDKTNEITSQAKDYVTLKASDFSIEEDKNAQEDFERYFARLTSKTS